MTRPRRVRLGILCCLGAAWLATGCGGKGPSVIGTTGARVKGRLLENGQPVKVRPGEDVVISFAPPDPADVTSTRGAASIDPKDGSFAFFGPNSPGGRLAPGKYRVSISSQTGQEGEGKGRFAAFASDRSPLEADVGPEEEQAFVIDIARKTVRKQ